MMIVSFKWLASVILAGALTVGVTVSEVHGQGRGMSMQRGMMMSMPVRPMMSMPVRPNPFMSRPMPMRPTPVVHPVRPITPTQIARDRIARERELWWRNRSWWNNAYGMGAYGMGSYSGLYGMSYGGSDLGNYASAAGYAPKNQRSEREQPPEAETKPSRSAQEQFEHFVSNPTTGEIMSGEALNTIVSDLRKLMTEQSADDMQAKALAMSNEALAHVNLTQRMGNIALLNRKGGVFWPAALGGSDDAELRAELGAGARAVVLQAQKGGPIDAGLVAQMAKGVEQLKKQLPSIARNQTFNSYVEAKAFINNLDDAVIALGQPDAISHFDGEYTVKAKTVPDLVRWLTDKGLQFAPAIPGDEAAYTALHGALAAYDKAVRTPKAASAPQSGLAFP